MVDSGIGQGLTSQCHSRNNIPLNAMLKIVYLKHEFQSTKHLVSLDAYNLFIAITITEAFSEFIKIQILPAVSHINIYQNSFTSCNHHHTNIARYSHSIHAI